MSMSIPSGKSVTIVGGGVIGLSIGWVLSKQGCAVTIWERGAAGREASWAAAGMLSALAEVHFDEQDLLRLGLVSARMYPEWVGELEAASGMSIGYRTDGTLIVGIDPDDARDLRHRYEIQSHFQLRVEWLRGAEARVREPLLSPRVTAAISCLDDHRVDNRRMVEALKVALQAAGGVLEENCPVEKIEIRNGRAEGVWVQGELREARTIILAAGCWSGSMAGLPDAVRPPVRPVKGQMIALQMLPESTLTNVVQAPDAYMVPKQDGRLFIGATCEEMGFDTQLTAGGMFELLRGAWEAVPGIYDFPMAETWVGLRPGSRDNAPILGKTPVEGLIMATGHFRKGILLTPVTAREIAALVLTGETSEQIAPLQLSRFTKGA
ncbi:MAG: glycine oxidase ThiO [bacterium]